MGFKMGALLKQFIKDRDRLYDKIRLTITGTAYQILNEFVMNSLASNGQFLSAWNLSYRNPSWKKGFYDKQSYSARSSSRSKVKARESETISSNANNLKGRRLVDEIFITNGAQTLFNPSLASSYDDVFQQATQEVYPYPMNSKKIVVKSWGRIRSTEPSAMDKLFEDNGKQCTQELMDIKV